MSSPKRGSMSFYPRVRAKSLRITVKSWPAVNEPVLLGFPAYKAFMCSAILLDNYEKSPTFGKEIIKACTILETPPIFIVGLKFYTKQGSYLKSLTTIFTDNIPDKIKKHIKIVFRSKKTINDVEQIKDKIVEIRALALTQPFLTSLGKKKPEIYEIKIGGDTSKAIEYGKSILGKEISIDEVFKELQVVDIIGVTKGKGFQGVVKRFGVKILPKWHKHRKGSRKVGSIGPIEPTLMRFVPRPGQMGFHRRTEYNKQIIQISKEPINKKGGIPHYGIIKNHCIVLLGSVMGPPKRPVFLRYPIRGIKKIKTFKLIKLLL